MSTTEASSVDQPDQEQVATPAPAPPAPVPAAPAPELTPANAVEGGREVSNKILYVGGLAKSVTDEVLTDLFSIGGPVKSVKILFDKNQQTLNYAFVEYEETQFAEVASQSLNGRVIDGFPIRINWAFQSQQLKSSDSFNVFVGDLSPEVNDEILGQVFSRFPTLLQAHVMWDMQTGRSRGYGFLSFAEQSDAEAAIQTMNGEWIAGRAIRLNWAAHKQRIHPHHVHHGHPHHHAGALMGNGANIQGGFRNGPPPPPNAFPLPGSGAPTPGSMTPSGVPGSTGGGFSMINPQNFDLVLRQAPTFNTTVYLGNLSHYSTQNDIIPALQQFGFIVDFKFHPERGCAFVKFDTHERAAMAIVNLNGAIINGRQIKSNWGKGDLRSNYKQAPQPLPVPQMYGQRFN